MEQNSEVSRNISLYVMYLMHQNYDDDDDDAAIMTMLLWSFNQVQLLGTQRITQGVEVSSIIFINKS